LSDGTVLLRELKRRDAASLLRHVNDPPVLKFIARCPSSVQGVERFIRWTHAERRRGRHACYGIVPRQGADAVGIIQIWSVERHFTTAEWGFAIGEAYWGTGVFSRAAHLFLDALFMERLFGLAAVHRLEARSVVHNWRGNRFLHKLGATHEGVLRSGFHEGDQLADQMMWSILAPEWIRRRAARCLPC
jgi:RimJ/RimL family protein N-acetyltransferase